ncbi:translationally-controlled tumor protein homolog [Sardina pilchardus]|uniref:translationally-controlled tumor protein homolog n=1 Tax=Sardina pilchardus TaxID=27697 RepID=UPI002E11B132
MIIYKDLLTGDEMFSDIYKIKETDMMYEVEGKMISRAVGDIDDSLIGGNASAEVADEGTDSSTVSGVDIVLNHKLQEMPPMDKKTYINYAKEYMKAVKAKLQETNPGRVQAFQDGAGAEVKKIIGKIKDYQFFCGESTNPDGAYGLLDFREDGITPYMLFFKDGLEVEKC